MNTIARISLVMFLGIGIIARKLLFQL